jgi:predicted nucleotidyltransferase
MIQAIDVRTDHLHQIMAILRAHLPEKVKVFAFGSRATRTARRFSDLDLCLRGTTRLSDDILSAIGNELEESELPFRVDVIDWHAISPSFRQAISTDLKEIDLRKRRASV